MKCSLFPSIFSINLIIFARPGQGPSLFQIENSIPTYTGCRTRIRLFSVGWEVLFYGRETICKGRVSKSSPEMRGRGMVSTGFSSRSCPLFTEVVYRGEQKNQKIKKTKKTGKKFNRKNQTVKKNRLNRLKFLKNRPVRFGLVSVL